MEFCVVGASGNVGRSVTSQLLEVGHTVLAVTRSGERRAGADGAIPVAVDATDADALDGMLLGVHGIFVYAQRNLADLLARAAEQGVERVVLLSAAIVESTRNDTALSKAHLRAEEAVVGSGMAWTVLRPQAFASNALRWLPDLAVGDQVPLPFWDLPVAYVDPEDIAAVGVAALLGEGHASAKYRLSGPEALLPEDALAIVGRALDRPLEAERLDDIRGRAHLLRDLPLPLVDSFFDLYRGGFDEGLVTDAVPRVTGRPAGRFDDWVTRNVDRFRPRR